MGRQSFNDKKFIEAIHYISQSIKLANRNNPELKGNYFNRGLCKYNIGDFRWALIDYFKALGYDEKYTDAISSIGNCFYKLRKFDSALKYLSLAISKTASSSNQHLLLKRADCKIKLSHFESAATDLNTLKESPEYKKFAFYSLGEIEYLRSNEASAKKYWDKAVEFGIKSKYYDQIKIYKGIVRKVFPSKKFSIIKFSDGELVHEETKMENGERFCIHTELKTGCSIKFFELGKSPSDIFIEDVKGPEKEFLNGVHNGVVKYHNNVRGVLLLENACEILFDLTGLPHNLAAKNNVLSFNIFYDGQRLFAKNISMMLQGVPKPYKEEEEEDVYTDAEYANWSDSYDEISQMPDPEGYLDYLNRINNQFD